jgi:hypothetical protein
MHQTTEEVILRILVQESLKSELWLRRYGEKNFRDLFVISGKWLGVFLEIFLNSRVPVGILVDRGLISDKCRGFFAKWWRILAGIYFSIGDITVDQVHGTWTGRRGSGPPWIEAVWTRGRGGAWRAGARARQCSPTMVEEDEAVPEGCSPEHERQRRGDAMEAKNGGGLSSPRG